MMMPCSFGNCFFVYETLHFSVLVPDSNFTGQFTSSMKLLTGLILIFACCGNCRAQYYYKDIIGTQQAMDKWKSYRAAKVSSVKVLSYESDGHPTDGFDGKQLVNIDSLQIITYTSTNMSQPTELISWYDAHGYLKKTLDTSDTYQSTTVYEYDPAGHVSVISNSSLETDNQLKTTEKHVWQYNKDGIPTGMLKIKSGTDTTFVHFVIDSSGNVAEERSERNRMTLPTVYYYYSGHALTDIVRYNEKADRLLPDYIFEYDAGGRPVSMLFVSPGTNDYQKWLYQYNEKGLRVKEACFNKRQELLGRIEYQYSYL